MAQTVGAEAVPFVWQRVGAGPALALGVALLALAGVSASATAGVWPANGFAAASTASQMVTASNAGGQSLFRLNVPDDVRALSESALLAEPASVQAVRNLALFHQAQGDAERARRLMRLAARISARDTVTNMFLVEDYLRAGDMPRATALIDASLRSDRAAGAALLPRLAQLLAEPGADAVLGDMLEGDPPWAHDFWSAVIEAGNAPVQAAALRTALHQQGFAMAAGHDARLIGHLVEARAFAPAFALHAAARHPATAMPPLDWRLGDARGLAVSQGDDGTIRASALAGSTGVVAQKLVQVPRGAVFVRVASNAAPGQLIARITCAHAAGEATLALSLPVTGDTSVRFENVTPCRYAWLTLLLDPAAAQTERALMIGAVSLEGGV